MYSRPDLTVSQGNTYEITYNIKNEDNSIKDLSGTITLKFALSKRKHSAELLSYLLGTNAELTIPAPTLGQVLLKLPSTALNLLEEGLYHYEIWQINALSQPTTLVSEEVLIVSKLIKE